jgi:hypothetical protein
MIDHLFKSPKARAKEMLKLATALLKESDISATRDAIKESCLLACDKVIAHDSGDEVTQKVGIKYWTKVKKELQKL